MRTASSKQTRAKAASTAVLAATAFDGANSGELAVTELIEQTLTEVPAVPAPDQILTIEPKEYVDAVFQPFDERLELAIAEARNTPGYDIGTPEGLATAKKLCLLFTKIRTDAERTREERKAPFLNMGRLLDARCKEVKTAVSRQEEVYATAIEAEEKRLADEQAARVAAERERQAVIEKKIVQIRSAPGMAVGQSLGNIATLIERLKGCVIDEAGYGEYVQIASDAKAASLSALETAYQQQKQAEENRAELDRLRAQLAAAQQAGPAAAAPAPGAAAAPAAVPVAPAAPVRVAAGGGRPAMTTPIAALTLCYEVLTGASQDKEGAIAKAAEVLRNYGRI